MQEGKVDWATAESLAIGALLRRDYNVRISGQDVTRGTFSHRHLTFFDQETFESHSPMAAIGSGRLSVNSSVLAELAVLSYEYGYSLENPRNLVIWEAQFGDFSNCAQVAFDNFVSSSEKKWLRQSSLVMTLPHGFDNAGPEHSSARIERYLQAVESSRARSEENKASFSVCNLTTAANFYHVLVRQMNRNYRKPLVVVSPKIGLKNKAYYSELSEITQGQFKPIIAENMEEAETVVFCSGQIFMEAHKIAKNKLGLIRIEEIAPFPKKEVKNALSKAKKATKFIWLQEEHINMGAHSFCKPYILKVLSELNHPPVLDYVGREAEIAANGCVNDSKKEREAFLNDLKNLI